MLSLCCAAVAPTQQGSAYNAMLPAVARTSDFYSPHRLSGCGRSRRWLHALPLHPCRGTNFDRARIREMS